LINVKVCRIISVWIESIAIGQSESLINKRCPCDPNELNSWDRSVLNSYSSDSSSAAAKTSDIIVVAALIAPVVIDWLDVGVSREFLSDMTVYAEVLSLNSALVSVTKYSVQRPRPKTYLGEPSYVNGADGYQSFYSGHVSTSFAALTAASATLQQRHPEYGNWPWIITAAVGTSVAFERVAAGQHFYTDVLVGAMVGTAIGVYVPHYHRKNGGVALCRQREASSLCGRSIFKLVSKMLKENLGASAHSLRVKDRWHFDS